MTSLWDRLWGRRASSADAARDRLKLVLVSDRSDISPEKLAQMQGEIIDVIKRYLEVDDAHVDIKLEQRARENYLVADIPLARDTSYAILPEVDAPPERPLSDEPSGTAPSDAPDEPDAPETPETPVSAAENAEDTAEDTDDTRATKPRKPRSTSSRSSGSRGGTSRGGSSRSRSTRKPRAPEPDTPSEPPAE